MYGRTDGRSLNLVSALVFAYTASGVIFAFLAILSIGMDRFREAFLYIFIATMIDYTDGSIGRRLGVYGASSPLDINRMDSVIDFVSNGLAPVLLLVRANRLPDPVYFWSCCILLVSLYRYSKSYDAAIERGLFTGLPVFWTFFMFYCFFLTIPEMVKAGIITIMSVLAFTSLKFIHVARFPVRRVTNVIGLLVWWSIFVVVTQGEATDRHALVVLSLVYPAYYLIVSFISASRVTQA